MQVLLLARCQLAAVATREATREATRLLHGFASPEQPGRLAPRLPLAGGQAELLQERRQEEANPTISSGCVSAARIPSRSMGERNTRPRVS